MDKILNIILFLDIIVMIVSAYLYHQKRSDATKTANIMLNVLIATITIAAGIVIFKYLD